jgi:DNA-binding CsgD family transcriptional regulator
MATDDPHETPLAKALRREKELQEAIKAATETIKVAMQEIEKIKQFREMYRSFSPEAAPEKGTRETTPPALRGAAHGNTQALFEALVLDILRDVGRPMNSTEFVDEFRKRGRPLGGNEIRTAWNRLWQARKSGVLVHLPKLGYWLPGEPLSEEAKANALIASQQTRRLSGKASVRQSKGKKKGPPAVLTPEQAATAERMLLTGRRLKEVAELFGIAVGTLTSYTGSIAEIQARHSDVVIPKRPYVRRPRRPGVKSLGRPPKLTPEQVQKVAQLAAEGKSVAEIANLMGVGRVIIYKALKKSEGSES